VEWPISKIIRTGKERGEEGEGRKEEGGQGRKGREKRGKEGRKEESSIQKSGNYPIGPSTSS